MYSTYNVMLRCVRAIIVAGEKQSVLHNLSVYICSLKYPACYARTPRCPPYFSTLSHKRQDLKKNHWTQNMCFDFLYKFVWNIFHSKKNWATFDQKCIVVFI